MSTTTTGGDEKDEEMLEARSSTGEGDGDADGDDGPYCVCQEKSYGEMIGCDNGSDCPYQWVTDSQLNAVNQYTDYFIVPRCLRPRSKASP
jgi:chromatin modification-related protein YNG2